MENEVSLSLSPRFRFLSPLLCELFSAIAVAFAVKEKL